MKKIINGKKYDTATAKKLAGACNEGTWSDFSHWEEHLYLKRTGEYFLHGEGGPATRYAERVDTNSWGYGEDIRPLSSDEARAWAEKNLNAGEFEELFGEVVEPAASSISDIRDASGMSYRALAERFGIPYRTMENWSAGVAVPPAYVLRMMCELLGIEYKA